MRPIRDVLAVTALWLLAGVLTAAATEPVTVYKSPTCGCCKLWVEHLRGEGFEVTVREMDDVTPAKRQLGVPPRLASCHTAEVGGYVVEGHVPASDIKRLLAARPDVAGLAVPGMPVGSPGMEFGPAQRYDVVTFSRDGSTSVFARH